MRLRALVCAVVGACALAGQAQAAAKPKVSTADRAAITALLNKYLPAAMERKNMKEAWELSGPEMKSGSTLFDWTTLMNTPVPYYLAREKTIADWETIDAGKNYVIVNFLLHPGKEQNSAPYAFSAEVVKKGSRWLVNRMYVIAIFNPVRHKKHELGPADFAAPATAGAGTGQGTHHLPTWVIGAVAAFVGAIILVPLLGFGAVGTFRAVKWRRERRRLGSELPPLPQSRITPH